MDKEFTSIVATDIAAAHLDDPAWAFIDCRFDLLQPEWGRQEYAMAHLPGAVYADLNRDLSGPVTPQTGRHPLPEPAAIIARFSSWGISPATQVVVYDAAGGSFAARLWWLLRYYGHTAVAVLDGSFQKWQREGRPLRSGVEARQAAQFVGQPDPGMWVSTAEVDALRQDPANRLVDARASARFQGEQEFIDPVSGHIPGAVNRFHGENLGPDGTFQPADRLKAAFIALLGGVPAANAIVYCGSGVTSCHHLVAMEYAGLSGTRLYPGSWSEWIRDPARPVAKKSN
jgi:thiosulfate/3-mercaptopyruvate sulfurtransferase